LHLKFSREAPSRLSNRLLSSWRHFATAFGETTMETSLSHSLVRLGAEQLFSVDAAPGHSLVVFHGSVWITQHDDPRDYIVSAGETFEFDHPGLALVEALEPTSLVVLVEATTAPDPIGYEAAWPQTEPARAQVDSYQLHQQARRFRAQAGVVAARGVASAARKVWSGLSSVTPQRQAA
jgi:hypothetical protein